MSASNSRQAKECLINRIVSEADRVGVELTETERKMMYFSETAWAPPDFMEVSDAFDRECDPADYERKIGGLVRSLRAHDRHSDTDAALAWDAAVARLRQEDHYLLVLIDAAPVFLTRTPFRLVTLLLWGLAGFVICSVTLLLTMKLMW